jgi:hypothetical protein
VPVVGPDDVKRGPAGRPDPALRMTSLMIQKFGGCPDDHPPLVSTDRRPGGVTHVLAAAIVAPRLQIMSSGRTRRSRPTQGDRPEASALAHSCSRRTRSRSGDHARPVVPGAAHAFCQSGALSATVGTGLRVPGGWCTPRARPWRMLALRWSVPGRGHFMSMRGHPWSASPAQPRSWWGARARRSPAAPSRPVLSPRRPPRRRVR